MLIENTRFFESHFPDWMDPLKSLADDPAYQIEMSKSGDPTLSVEKDDGIILFHSKYHPKREAAKLIKAAVDEEPEVLIIGGIGLGYLVEEALNLFQRCEVVVCDFDWHILKSLLENRPVTHLFSHPRVHTVFADNPQALIEVMKPFQTTKIQLITHQPSYRLHPDYYDKLKSAVDHFQNTKEINVATLNRFQKLWTKNILKNLSHFITHKGVRHLFDQFKGIPCVVVAAGPSLAKNIDLLKDIKGKGIIISVDTSFQILQAHGIDPDFVIAVDPQDINKKYFENLKKSDAILVCEPSISPRIVRQYTGKKLMLGSLFHLVEWLEGMTEVKGNIEIGGSVATAAYGLGVKLGCDPIVFIGLDLAYSTNQTHMKGAYFEENWFYQWNRFENNHTLSRSFLKKFGLFDVKAYDGGFVKSDRKFQMFQTWFESQFKKVNNTIIDATEGGAFIKNCEALPFKEVVRQYFCNPNGYRQQIEGISKTNVHLEGHKTLLAKVLQEMEQQLSAFHRLDKEVKKGKQLAKELYNHVFTSIRRKAPLPKRVQAIHTQLDAIDSMITSDSTLNALISITIQNIINEIGDNSDKDLNEMERQNHGLKVAKQSVNLYNGVAEGIQFNVEQFSKAIQRAKKQLPH